MSVESDSRYPRRRRLPHAIPPWVPDGSTYFITINCEARDRNQLAVPSTARAIRSSFGYQIQTGKWHVDLLLLMPDHLHAIMSCRIGVELRPGIIYWKRYMRRTLGIRWQADFFEHRIRNARSYEEKWQYIINNPTRKGLIEEESHWPYVWTYSELLGESGKG